MTLDQIDDMEAIRREISARLYELDRAGIDVTTFSWRADELLDAGNFMGLRDLDNEMVAALELWRART